MVGWKTDSRLPEVGDQHDVFDEDAMGESEPPTVGGPVEEENPIGREARHLLRCATFQRLLPNVRDALLVVHVGYRAANRIDP